MSTKFIELIGFIAATLTTLAFVPQVWLIWKTRQTEGISVGMYAIFTAGVMLWLIYGLKISSWPIVLANAITLSLSLSILLMKFLFSRNGN
jgi:MtN3 and saliva related transmembrane protein